MRKSLLTLALITGSVVAVNAQSAKFSVSKLSEPTQALSMQKHVTREEAPLLTTKAGISSVSMNGNKRLVKSEAAADSSLVYGLPTGALYYGLTDESSSYSAIQMITGAFKDVTFINYSSVGGTRITDVEWTWPSGKPLSGTEKVDARGSLTAQAFGRTKFPVMQKGSYSYGSTFLNSSDKDVSAYWNAGIEGCGVITFGNADGTTEDHRGSIGNAAPPFGFYSGFGGDYRFKSNATFYSRGNGSGWTDTGKKLVGFAEYYSKPLGYVYAEDVTAWFWADGVDAASPLSGKTVKATICTFDAEGKMVPYAEATAEDADAEAVGTNGLYLISFKFTEEDPILGKVDAPIALPEEDFIVLLTGFDQVAGHFTATFAGAEGDDGNAFAILEDGSLATIAYSNSPSPQCNLHIGFHAAVPVAELAVPENGVAVLSEAGGYAVTSTDGDKNYNDVDIYALEGSDKWEVEKPEWIDEVEFDDSYISRGMLVAYIKGQALPEGVEGRTGKVVFTLYGKNVEVTVNQGKVTTAISSVENSETKKNGAIYNIAGQKVNKDYKGIVIKDGRKLIQK